MTSIAASIVGHSADLIRRDGWIQGNASTDDGRCMYGALLDALLSMPIEVGNGQAMLEAIQAVNEKVDEVTGQKRWGAMSDWNDEPGRTADEVLNLLEKARIGLEERVA